MLEILLSCQYTVFQLQYAGGLFRQFRIVRHNNQACAHAEIKFEHQVEYLSRRASVEISGRFICEHAGGASD